MRKDMGKVVTEAPRYGHKNRSKKTALRIRRWDRIRYYDGKDGLDGPRRISSSRTRQYDRDAKDFSDVLSPLKKFLHRQVGRHWDKVYSEMSQALDKRSLTGRHIWLHVWQFVEKDVMIGPDKKVYRKTAHLGRRPKVSGLYIHPKTGVLSRAK